ncbi:hypothetical protein MMC29_001629 [Sticta canariensis]|nr:hypothetical protein [Sticta canariensis]
MEPIYKRRCVPRKDDPNAEFHERRARNDQRLKSTFEAIFEKYGKDFSAIADEINLQTGEIVVNRGHVLGLKDETDPGCEDDLYDELNPDEKAEKLDRQGRADLMGLDPDNSLNDFTAFASEAPCYSESGNDSLMGDIDEKLSRIEPELSVRKGFRGGHRDQSFRIGPCAAENGGSKLSWKSRLRPHPADVTSPPQRALGPSFNDGQAAVELAWRAPPLPKRVASDQQVASGSLFDPHHREHKRFASPSDASLWAPETSNIYSGRPGTRRKKNSSTRRPKSLAVAQPPTLGKDFPKANVSSLDYEWPKFSVRSRQEEKIEKNVPLTLPGSSISLDLTKATAWTLGEDQLLYFLKSIRMPYSTMVGYYPIRTEVDLEDRWFALHGLNNKLLSLKDYEPRTLDQRTTASHNKDHQTSHYNPLPTLQSHVPDDHYLSTDLCGYQGRVLPKVTKNAISETRYFGSEKQPGKQQAQSRKSRKSFKDVSQSTFTPRIASGRPTGELGNQLNYHPNIPTMSSSIGAKQKDSDRVKSNGSYIDHLTDQDSTVVPGKVGSNHCFNPKPRQRSSDFPEKSNILEETPKASREKSVDNHWKLPIEQDRTQDTSKFTNATCKNCFSQNTFMWHTKGRSRLCNACYFYTRRTKKVRPQSLELKRVGRKSRCYSSSHMPVRKPSSISHDAKAADTSVVDVSKSQARSNKTSRRQTINQEAPRPAKSTTTPISPYDNLSDDELSMSTPTAGTTATMPNKLTTPSSHAPRRQTFHV